MFFRKRSEAYVAVAALTIVVVGAIISTYLYYNNFAKKCNIETPCIFLSLGTRFIKSNGSKIYEFHGLCLDKSFKALEISIYDYCSYRFEYSYVATLITIFGIGFVLFTGILGWKYILSTRKK